MHAVCGRDRGGQRPARAGPLAGPPAAEWQDHPHRVKLRGRHLGGACVPRPAVVTCHGLYSLSDNARMRLPLPGWPEGRPGMHRGLAVRVECTEVWQSLYWKQAWQSLECTGQYRAVHGCGTVIRVYRLSQPSAMCPTSWYARACYVVATAAAVI